MNVTLLLVGSLFLLGGGAALAGAVYQSREVRKLVAEGLHADGLVLDLVMEVKEETITDHDTGKETIARTAAYHPIVEFSPRAATEPHRFKSLTGNNPPAYKKGERVPVIYLADDLSSARISNKFELWGLVMILGGMGCLFVVVSAILFLVAVL